MSKEKPVDWNSVDVKREPSERKTIPKMSEKPPIYRMANKENTKNNRQKSENQKFFKPPVATPFSCDSSKSQQSNRSSIG